MFSLSLSVLSAGLAAFAARPAFYERLDGYNLDNRYTVRAAFLYARPVPKARARIGSAPLPRIGYLVERAGRLFCLTDKATPRNVEAARIVAAALDDGARLEGVRLYRSASTGALEVQGLTISPASGNWKPLTA